jgi:hypothetical protein
MRQDDLKLTLLVQPVKAGKSSKRRMKPWGNACPAINPNPWQGLRDDTPKNGMAAIRSLSCVGASLSNNSHISVLTPKFRMLP